VLEFKVEKHYEADDHRVSLLLAFGVGCDEGQGRQLARDRQLPDGTKLFGERTLKDGTKKWAR